MLRNLHKTFNSKCRKNQQDEFTLLMSDTVGFFRPVSTLCSCLIVNLHYTLCNLCMFLQPKRSFHVFDLFDCSIHLGIFCRRQSQMMKAENLQQAIITLIHLLAGHVIDGMNSRPVRSVCRCGVT